MRLLPITELSSSTVTRTKANEAYRNLTHYIRPNERLLIGLEGPVSLSFLDQLIYRLKDSQALQKITFFVNSKRLYESLAQIAAARNAAIHYRTPDEDTTKLIQFSAAATRTIEN